MQPECPNLPAEDACLRDRLDSLYAVYNRRDYVHPDPIEVLYGYEEPLDREIAALVASSLAYGRVKQILRSVTQALGRMPSPGRFLSSADLPELQDTFADFRHRFTSGSELARLLYGIRRILETHGTLESAFLKCTSPGDETAAPALARFARALRVLTGKTCSPLFPDPARGSACKRSFLFLRWMVRRDDVDPGVWQNIPASRLVVPLDTHMFRIAAGLGFTRRRQPDLRTALEITAHFRAMAPEDPVKYDFALTRFGIRSGLNREGLMRALAQPAGRP